MNAGDVVIRYDRVCKSFGPKVVLKDLAPGDYEVRVNAGPRYVPAKALVRVHGGEATRAVVKVSGAR